MRQTTMGDHFYSFSDEADSESSPTSTKYRSANTSFSEIPRMQDMTEPQCQRRSSDVNDEAVQVPAESPTEARSYCYELDLSIWATPVKNSSNCRKESTAVFGQEVAMKADDDHKCVPRFADLTDCTLRFIPGPTSRNLYRHVVLYGLKPTCSIAQVLEQVRGGLIVDAKLVDTVSITGSKSALISFFEEHAAISFQYHVSTHDIIINGKNITASMVSTPSRPLNLVFKRAIRELHHTRCLEIKNFPQEVSAVTLRRELEIYPSLKYDAIEHMKMDARGTLMLYFVSVMAAQHAFHNLSHRQKYRYCRIRYAQDPCALPFDEDSVNVGAQNRGLARL